MRRVTSLIPPLKVRNTMLSLDLVPPRPRCKLFRNLFTVNMFFGENEAVARHHARKSTGSLCLRKENLRSLATLKKNEHAPIGVQKCGEVKSGAQLKKMVR